MEMTSMVTRIRNDVGGQLVIPNTAIVQGSVIITRVSDDRTLSEAGRLPYRVGDRVYTTYMSEEGEVKELNPFYTKILLDSGRELTFLNTTVLSGSAAVAKICSEPEDLKFSFKVDGDIKKIIESVRRVASSNPSVFKSNPVLLYSSLEGKTVGLEFSCRASPNMKKEAKSMVLETVYSSNHGKSKQ
jgi:small-conductance mechanosensitive channel